MKTKIGYWASTLFVALLMGTGGVFMVLHMPENIEGLAKLGYPAYLATVLGTGKLLFVIVTLAPRLPRLKEWAYAGGMIDFFSASFSHYSVGDSTFHVIAPLVVAAIAFASWRWRPESRVLGSLARG